MPYLQNLLGDPDQDLVAFQQGIQDQWDTIVADQAAGQ